MDLTDTSGEAAGTASSADEEHIGLRLRELRLGRRLTLKAVSTRAGVSEGFLSQIERGRAAPSLKTLQAIAHALGIEVGDFFADPTFELPHVTPISARAALEIGSLSKFRVTPKALPTLEVLGGTFEPGGTAGAPYTHGDSDEVFIVVSGTVRAEVEGRTFEMGAGDSLCFRSSMPHTFHNTGEDRAEVLWVVCPPSW